MQASSALASSLVRVIHAAIAIDISIFVLFVAVAGLTDLRACGGIGLPPVLCSPALALVTGTVLVACVVGTFIVVNRRAKAYNESTETRVSQR